MNRIWNFLSVGPSRAEVVKRFMFHVTRIVFAAIICFAVLTIAVFLF